MKDTIKNCSYIISIIFLSVLKAPKLHLIYLNQYYILWLVPLLLFSISLFKKNIKIRNECHDIISIILVFILLMHIFYKGTSNLYHVYSWYYIGGILLFFNLKKVLITQKLISKILITILILSFFEMTLGFLQYIQIFEPSSKYVAMGGTFKGKNHLAAFLCMGFLSAIYLIFNSEDKPVKIGLSIISVLLLTMIFITKSRGAILSLIISLYFLVTYLKHIIKKKHINIIQTVLIFTSILFLHLSFIKNNNSINGRYLITKITLLKTIEKPIIGHGLHNFAKEYSLAKSDYFSTLKPWNEQKVANPVSVAYNDFLDMIFEIGYPFTILFLCLLLILFFKTPNSLTNVICKSSLLFLCLFAISNTVRVYPVFNLIEIIAGSRLFQQIKFKNNNHTIKKNITLQLGILFLSLTLIIIIVQRSYSEYVVKKNYIVSNYSTEKVNQLLKLSPKINERGRHLYEFSTFLKKNKQDSLAFELLKKSASISYNPIPSEILAKEYIRQKNFAKADSLYKNLIKSIPYKLSHRFNLMKLYIKALKINKAKKIAKKIIDLPIKIPSQKAQQIKKETKKLINNIPTSNNKNLSCGSISGQLNYRSKILNINFPYKVYIPKLRYVTDKLPVIFINDGKEYISKGKLPQKIDKLIKNKVISPLVAVFIDPVDLNMDRKNLRTKLFINNKNFVLFYKDELIPYLSKKFPIGNSQKDRTIWGASFGGLFALDIANKEPQLFKNIIMQSPAFHPYKRIYRSFINTEKRNFKLYMSYGTGKDTEKQDIPMIKILKEKGYNLKVNRIENGNHSWREWEKELDSILVYFYNDF